MRRNLEPKACLADARPRCQDGQLAGEQSALIAVERNQPGGHAGGLSALLDRVDATDCLHGRFAGRDRLAVAGVSQADFRERRLGTLKNLFRLAFGPVGILQEIHADVAQAPMLGQPGDDPGVMHGVGRRWHRV